MLEAKTKDRDASIELLEDRERKTITLFALFYFIGGAITIWGGLIAQFLESWIIMGMTLGIGLSFMIIAGYFLMLDIQYHSFIFINTKLEEERLAREIDNEKIKNLILVGLKNGNKKQKQ